MQTVVIVLTVIVAILLIGIVLIQKSKGGGLSSQFGGAGAVMGVRQTNTFLEKGTWTLVGILVFLSFLSAWVTPDAVPANGLRAVPTQTEQAPILPAAGQLDAAPLATPQADAAVVEVEETTETAE